MQIHETWHVGVSCRGNIVAENPGIARLTLGRRGDHDVIRNRIVRYGIVNTVNDLGEKYNSNEFDNMTQEEYNMYFG